MDNPSHSGPITCMCLDKKRAWVVTGTASGVLTLWDIRFGLMIKTWKTATASAGGSSRIHQCTLHPSRGRGRWIIVAVEAARSSSEVPSTLMEVWDIETTKLVEVYGTRMVSKASAVLDEPQDLSGGTTEPSAAMAIAALVRARQGSGPQGMHRPSTEGPSREFAHNGLSLDIRALVVGLEFGGHSTVHRSAGSSLNSDGHSTGGRGFMVSGSADRKLTLWDIGKVERTTILSGAELESEKPNYRYSSSENTHVATNLMVWGDSSTISCNSITSHVETWLISPQASCQQNRPPQRMMLLNNSQQNLLKPHQDTITALACIDSPFRCGIVSGDRAGNIKVWRVDGTD